MAKYYFIPILAISLGLLSCKFDSTPKEMNYGGVSFQYPRTWSSETEKLDEGAYYMACEQRLGSDIVVVCSFDSDDIDLDFLIDNYFSTLDNSLQNLSKGASTDSQFAGYECTQISYTAKAGREAVYGSIYLFYANGRTIMLAKQTNTEKRLEKNFELIENSFEVKPLIIETITEIVEEE